jgi:hypothetical protein
MIEHDAHEIQNLAYKVMKHVKKQIRNITAQKIHSANVVE